MSRNSVTTYQLQKGLYESSLQIRYSNQMRHCAKFMSAIFDMLVESKWLRRYDHDAVASHASHAHSRARLTPPHSYF